MTTSSWNAFLRSVLITSVCRPDRALRACRPCRRCPACRPQAVENAARRVQTRKGRDVFNFFARKLPCQNSSCCIIFLNSSSVKTGMRAQLLFATCCQRFPGHHIACLFGDRARALPPRLSIRSLISFRVVKRQAAGRDDGLAREQVALGGLFACKIDARCAQLFDQRFGLVKRAPRGDALRRGLADVADLGLSSTGAASSASKLRSGLKGFCPPSGRRAGCQTQTSSRDRSRVLPGLDAADQIIRPGVTFFAERQQLLDRQVIQVGGGLHQPCVDQAFARLPSPQRRCPSRRARQSASDCAAAAPGTPHPCSGLLLPPHRQTPARRTPAEPRHFKGLRVRRTLVLSTPMISGMISPALRTDTVSPTRTSSWRMNRGCAASARDTVVPAKPHRLEYGVRRPARPCGRPR